VNLANVGQSSWRDKTWVKEELGPRDFAECGRAVAGIDTIKLYVAKPLTSFELSKVWQVSGRRLLQISTSIPQFPFRFLIQQPDCEVLPCFAGRKHVIGRMDMFVDLLADCKFGAKVSAEAVQKRLVLRGQRAKAGRTAYYQGQDGRTYYWNEAAGRRNVRLYYDLPSKQTGGVCAHIEVVRNRARLCRAVGLSQIEDLLGDDLGEKLARFWALDVSLYELRDPAAFNADVDGYIEMEGLKVGEVRQRLFGSQALMRWSSLSIQRIRDGLPRSLWERHLVRLSMDYLPEIEWPASLINTHTPHQRPFHLHQRPQAA